MVEWYWLLLAAGAPLLLAIVGRGLAYERGLWEGIVDPSAALGTLHRRRKVRSLRTVEDCRRAASPVLPIGGARSAHHRTWGR